MTPKPLRFIVQNPGELHDTTYNAAHGKDALSWAVQNARSYHGRVLIESSDGSVTIYKSFERDVKPALNRV